MSTKPKGTIDAGQVVPDLAQAEVVEQLLATMSDDANELTAEEIAAELERRKNELKQHGAKPSTPPSKPK